MTEINGSDSTTEALLESERRLSRAQAIAHVGDWEWEVATNVVRWSDELYRIYGFEPREIAPDYSLILQQMHPDSKAEFLVAIEAALNDDTPFEMNYAFFRRDGSEAYLHTIGQVIRDEKGAPVRMVGVVQDITEQRRAEILLMASEDKCRTIFDKANDGILITDIEKNRFVEANRTIGKMLGYTKEELFALGVDDIHLPQDLPAVRDVFARQLRGELSLAENVPVKRKDNSLFFADINAAVMNIGGRACLLGVFRDVTERRLVEETLKAQGQRLAESQRIAHIGSWEHNLETNQAIWSDELFRLLGLDPQKDHEDFDLFFSMIHPEDQPQLKGAIEETLRSQKPFNVEYRFNRNDGQSRILHAQAELIPDSSGKLVVLSGTGQDITERKLAEEKIRRSEEYVRNILDTVDEGFIVVDRSYRIMSANRAYCSAFGVPVDQVLGRYCFEVSHKLEMPCHEAGEECSVNRVFATGLPHTTFHRHEDAEGSTTYVETKAFPLRDETGAVTQVIETINDITEKRLLEEERLKVQKLEAIGTLAGGIAHDFNNLLQGVFGYISLAKMGTGLNRETNEFLEEAEKALNLTVNLTTQLLTFSKGGKPVKRSANLGPVVENGVRFSLSGSSTGCCIVQEDDLWPVEMDEGQISQVIQNIILNASQAMAEGGRVEVSLRNIPSGDPVLPDGLAVGPYVEVAVRDEGIGIQEKNLTKIFDPYFTTKTKGSGLGLATSYSIIKNHDGRIMVASTPGEGTTFHLFLPASETIQADDQPIVVNNEPIRPGKILIMDDEPMVCSIAGAMIKSLGHQVDYASNGEEAIDTYRVAMQKEEPFDVVILDLTIRGGMGGEETIRRLLAMNPEVVVVVSSGYADSPILANYREYGFKAILSKPYTLKNLESVIQAVFNREKQGVL
ncbi:MAG: PAS domain S-box protein [Proteobacteria bacterium]|nr:PAS domain S-box protein [Pseudomonadota bacterium]MBU1688826.1 PAS domain S-box protein [Pseudomonadota bacterium]